MIHAVPVIYNKRWYLFKKRCVSDCESQSPGGTAFHSGKEQEDSSLFALHSQVPRSVERRDLRLLVTGIT
jgi:hypothetical protein